MLSGRVNLGVTYRDKQGSSWIVFCYYHNIVVFDGFQLVLYKKKKK